MHPTRGTGHGTPDFSSIMKDRKGLIFLGKKNSLDGKERGGEREMEREGWKERGRESSWSPAKRKRRLFILPHDLKVSPVNKVEDIYRAFALFEDWSELQVNSRRFRLWR